MVVMGTCIEIYQYRSSFNSSEKLSKVKLLKNENVFIMKKFDPFLAFYFCLNIETVNEFSPRFMVKIIEAPIGLGAQFAETHSVRN